MIAMNGKRKSGGVMINLTFARRRINGVWVDVLLMATASPTTVTGSGSTATVTSTSSTATVTGGTGTITYNWVRVSGNTTIIPLSPGLATTQFRSTAVPVENAIVAVFRCDCTRGGVTVSTNNVTVTLTRI